MKGTYYTYIYGAIWLVKSERSCVRMFVHTTWRAGLCLVRVFSEYMSVSVDHRVFVQRGPGGCILYNVEECHV